MKDILFRVFHSYDFSNYDNIHITLDDEDLKRVEPSKKVKEKIIEECKKLRNSPIIKIDVDELEYNECYHNHLIDEEDNLLSMYANYLHWNLEEDDIYN